MRKLFISLCATFLLGASTLGYADSVVLVNKYNQPVTFAVSQGSLYNPVILGTLGALGKTTINIAGPITSDFHFMAFPPNQSMVVTDCGRLLVGTEKMKIKAGLSKQTGMFTCQIYTK